MILLPLLADVEVVEINGIYYNLSTENKTADVNKSQNDCYSGVLMMLLDKDYQGH